MNDTNEEDWMEVEDSEEYNIDDESIDLPTESLDEVLKEQEEKFVEEIITSHKSTEENKTIENIEIAKGERLPELLEGWVKEATNVSH